MSAIALGHALQLNNGFYRPDALAWLTVALACGAVGVAGPRSPREREGLVLAVLVAGIAWQIASLLAVSPGMYLHTNRLAPFRTGVAAQGAVVALGLLPSRRLRAAWFPMLAAISVALGCWLIAASPSPHIDVVTVHDAAFRALLHGHNPYRITFRNIYGPGAGFYAPEDVSGGRVLFGYPYPPLSLLMVLPGYALGDYRYAELAAIVLSACLIAYGRPSERSRLAAALLLTTPRVFFVLEQGWTEPVAVLLVALTVFAMSRLPRASDWIAGLMLASKQYLVIAVPLLWLDAKRRGRSPVEALGRAIGAGAIVTLPFFLWAPRAFVQVVLLQQARDPFRMDALSYLAWLARHGWGAPSFVWTAAAMIVALVVAMARAGGRSRDGDSPAVFAAALAFASLATFAFGRKAFCNYYFFVIGTLCCAVAAAHAPGGERPATPAST